MKKRNPIEKHPPFEPDGLGVSEAWFFVQFCRRATLLAALGNDFLSPTEGRMVKVSLAGFRAGLCSQHSEG